MADEDITLDGKPLQSLRVADLKAALEKRNLPKSGQKNALIKRLKGALMLENLQKSSSTHIGLQPNSQIGEEMSQNSFIKQYLAKQQELLRQRLEREAQQAAETSESPEVPEDDEDGHSEGNESASFLPDKHRLMPSQPPLTRAEEEGGGLLMGPASALQRPSLQPAPSPPRAVASLSVRVLGQPDRQGLPPGASRAQEKDGAAPGEPGWAHPALRLSRARGPAQEDSDEDSEEPSEDDEDEEEWGPGARRPGRGGAPPPQPSAAPPAAAAAAAPAAPRSRRKLQPPQHIPPPPQVHQPPMQLRHPTPPPSPPPELSFPLPDTPKQSPRDADEPDRAGARLPPALRRQDSDSSSRSSSPEPPQQRRPGGAGMLTLLARKIEAERGFPPAGGPLDMSGGGARAGCSRAPMAHQEDQEEEEKSLKEEKRKQEEEKEEREKTRLEEEKRRRREQEEEEVKKKQREEEEDKKRRQAEEAQKEKKRGQEEERKREKKRQEEEKKREQKRLDDEEEEKKKKRKEAEQKEKEARKGGGDRAGSPKRSVLVRAPAGPPVSSSPSKRPRAFSDTLAGSTEAPTKLQRGSAVTVSEAKDSGSSSDSDSGSDSSSRSSSSRPKQLKKDDRGRTTDGEKKRDVERGAERRYPTKREVSEPSAAAVTEVEPDTEGPMAQQPASEAEPDNSDGRLEESTTPKAFAARRISLTTGSKTSPAGAEGGSGGGVPAAGDSEAGGTAGRKRRWGSSTAVTAKKPSISITTDSLKSLIPDIKVGQEAVVELHPEELQLSGDEENREDQDKGLRIRRTVTQVVAGDGHENGRNNEEEEDEEEEEEKKKEEEDADKAAREKRRRSSRDKRKDSHCEETMETQPSVKHDADAKKVTPSDSLVRRSISQQNAGVSVTLDDPVRTAKQASPPRGKVSNIVHITNLVRPFTLGQLKELLNRTGGVLEEAFWIDKIKSHCYVTYATSEEAVATRTALHGVKWPQSNPKVLNVDFCEQDELDFHKGLLKPDRAVEDHAPPSAPPQARLPPLMPERDRERDRERGAVNVRDQWAEREREMERRERARGEREWDRDKIREFGRPGEESRRSRSRERRRRERAKSKERKTDKKEKADDPPPKLLDDLFLKTKAAPCIYWLPLTEEQALQKVKDRAERQKERERRRKEQEEEEDKKREEEKKERLKAREKEGAGAGAAVVVVGSGGAGARGADGERGARERERGRERDGDKRKDGYRPRVASGSASGGRRSRSRSNPRDRRR